MPTPPRAGRWASAAVAAGLVAAFWHHGERFIAANGPTFDEAVHLAAGYSYWATGEFRLNVEDPPFPKLAWAVPLYLADPTLFRPDPDQWVNGEDWRIGNAFLFTEPGRAERLLAPARRVNLLFGAGVVVLAGWWAYRLWGGRLAGLAATALAAFDPTLTALSGVLTTDAAVTLFVALTCYLGWEYAGRPNRWVLAAAGVSFGLALGSKFSAVFAAAAVAAGAVGYVLAGGSFGGTGGPLRDRLGSAVAPAVRVTVIALLTLVSLYFVVHYPQWSRGLNQQLARDSFDGPRYFFLGEVTQRGSPGYFPVALALKLPLGTTLLFAASLLPFRTRPGAWGPRLALVAVPPLAFLGLMTLTGVNLGVRVVLPVVPFVYLFAARLAAPGAWRAGRLFAVAVGAAGTAFAGVRAAPHQLAYFTEPVGGPANAIRLLGDSNLDWGQDLPALRGYVERERLPVIYLSYSGTAPPRYYGIRYQHLPGWGAVEPPPADRLPADAARHVVAVSASNLQGTYLDDPAAYAWLRDRRPDAILGGSIWVFDLTDDPDGLTRLRRLAGP